MPLASNSTNVTPGEPPSADPRDSRRRHDAPAAHQPSVPEPSFSERVRTLLHVGRVGTLATLSRHRPGFPFASVMPYGLDATGQPTFLISTMAMHTQNLESDGRASLLVTQPGWTEDPLAGARATLVGTVDPIDEGALAEARDDYLARHESARSWVDFDDFAFWKLKVEEIYFVAGFGAMGWVGADEYHAAEADPLSGVAAGILAHMNADHASALALYATYFANTPTEEATMTAVDRLGFRLRVKTVDRLQAVRIAFPEEVRSAEDARRVLVAMVHEARGALGTR